MNKSKILKILSLTTLGIGAIAGSTVALTSCSKNDDKDKGTSADISTLSADLFKADGLKVTLGKDAAATTAAISAAISVVIKAQSGFDKWDNSVSGVTTLLYADKDGKTQYTAPTAAAKGLSVFFAINVKSVDGFKDADLGTAAAPIEFKFDLEAAAPVAPSITKAEIDSTNKIITLTVKDGVTIDATKLVLTKNDSKTPLAAADYKFDATAKTITLTTALVEKDVLHIVYNGEKSVDVVFKAPVATPSITNAEIDSTNKIITLTVKDGVTLDATKLELTKNATKLAAADFTYDAAGKKITLTTALVAKDVLHIVYNGEKSVDVVFHA